MAFENSAPPSAALDGGAPVFAVGLGAAGAAADGANGAMRLTPEVPRGLLVRVLIMVGGGAGHKKGVEEKAGVGLSGAAAAR